jgi:DnaJ-class molecular chaperone
MSCICILCPDCNGSGNVWEATNGYPEEELEACPTCGGSGITDFCDECEDMKEREQW